MSSSRKRESTVQYLYISHPGVTVDVSAVNIRKYPEPIYPEPVTTGTKAERDAANAANRAAAEQEAADKVKPARFRFIDAESKPVAFLRYGFESLDTIRAYIEGNADERAAILAKVTPVKASSPISPTRAHLALMSSTFGRDELAAQWASGILVVPSTRASVASESKRKAASMTAEERRAAVLDSLFGPVAGDEPSEPSADDASGPVLADVPPSEPTA